MTTDKFFTEYKLSKSITLKNKIIMAPLTRCFADDDLVPTELSAKYYERRADAGLIISEATLITQKGQGYPNTPGIYNEKQIQAWKNITQKVHDKGGKMFSQIWHTGKISHSSLLDGDLPVSASAVRLEGIVSRTDNLSYETPRALENSEVKTIVEQFISAAKNAMSANFDGVEIHGANGYLIDQFLLQETNVREDEYGGSIENRARFALEIVDGVVEALGADKVGIRLSPATYTGLGHTKGDEDTYIYLLKEIEKRELAYVHVGIFDDSVEYDYLQGTPSEFIRKHYNGTLISTGGYTPNSSIENIENGKYDLIALGRVFISNPDLVEKIKNNSEIIEYEESALATLY